MSFRIFAGNLAFQVTDEDRKRLAGGVEQIFRKEANLERLLGDVRRSVERHALS